MGLSEAHFTRGIEVLADLDVETLVFGFQAVKAGDVKAINGFIQDLRKAGDAKVIRRFVAVCRATPDQLLATDATKELPDLEAAVARTDFTEVMKEAFGFFVGLGFSLPATPDSSGTAEKPTAKPKKPAKAASRSAD